MESTIRATPRTLRALEQGMIDGLHVGAQLYVSLRGAVVADAAIGEARRGVPMRPDTLMLWLSATKPVAAVAVAQLWERGLLDPDDPVARHIPEFAARGKERITVRHILTHTAGIRAVTGNWEEGSWDQIIAAICDARPEPKWEPGKKAGYHLATSWYLLGELVRRLDGRSFERYVREAIFEPLAMNDSWVGMPRERYRAYGERIGFLHRTESQARRGPDAKDRSDFADDTEEGAAACRPGRNGHGPARELGLFYEMLLRRGATSSSAAPRILAPQTVDTITAPHRVGMYDQTFRHVIDWGLGFIVNSNRYGVDTVPYGFGPHASDRAFGHAGSQSSSAFADPEHGLAVAVLCNGTPGEVAHQTRMRAIHSAIYEDLGLTKAD